MKSLFLIFVIAFVLKDYGTFQDKPVDPKDVKQVGLFKKYALELVQAAVKPIQESEEFMEGGCECLSGIDAFEHVNFKDPVLAMMSIAKNYLKDLQLIQETSESNLPGIMSEIENGMMENIRLILAVLQTSQVEINENSDTMENTYDKYLMKPDQGTFTSAEDAGDDDQNLESRLKCYRTLVGIEENDDFVHGLEDGFDMLRYLLTRGKDRSTGDRLWAKVDEIIENISAYKLEPAPPQSKEQLDRFLSYAY